MSSGAMATVHQPRLGRLVRWLAECPLTVGVLATLLAVTAYLDARPADTRAVVAWASTNLHNLADHPVAAMLTSMFVTPGYPWLELVLVAGGCGLVEHRLGVLRTIAIALCGQVIATVLTEFGAALGALLHLTGPASPDRSDVGVSYAMFALLGAAALQLPRRIRLPALALLAAAVAAEFALDPDLTTTGHLISLACGVASGALAARRPIPSTGPARAGEGGRPYP